MPLPEITHLQFLVLSILTDKEAPGRLIREKLAEHGGKKSGPAFYQFMARLEESGFIEGWYDQKVVEGQIIKERHYRITGEGLRAYQSVRDFYFTHIGLGLQGA
jgi:DNA-binding PadR family transcriptional regulator